MKRTPNERIPRNEGRVKNSLLMQDILAWMRALRDSNLPLKAKAVGFALALYADGNGECYPGYRKLARDLGVSQRTIRRALLLLSFAGFISYRKGRGRTTSRYLLLNPASGKPLSASPVSPLRGQEGSARGVRREAKRTNTTVLVNGVKTSQTQNDTTSTSCAHPKGKEEEGRAEERREKEPSPPRFYKDPEYWEKICRTIGKKP